MAVGDGFRQPGGAAGEENPERQMERTVVIPELLARHWLVVEQLVPVLGSLRRGGDVVEGQVDDVLQAAQVARDLAELGAAVIDLAVVGVAAGADQRGRLELTEPVKDAAPAEVGGDARPDRPDGRDGEHGDDGLGDVRQRRGDAVARLDAEVTQRGGEDPDLAGEVVPVQRGDRGGLRVIVEGDLARRLAGHDVLGVVEQRAGEPLRARHPRAAQDRSRLLDGDDVVVVPDGLPERPGLGHRPLPELGVAGELQAAGLLQPRQVRGDVRARDALLRRHPEQVAGLHRPGHRIAGGQVHGDGADVRAHIAEVRITGGPEAMAGRPSSARAILVANPKSLVDGMNSDIS